MHFPALPDDLNADPLLFQITCLADLQRVDAYRQAIPKIVRPGDIVADVGCGSGLLGRLCLAAGAGKVFMIDLKPKNILIARELNAYFCPNADIVPLNEDATTISLSQPVDLVVSELIGVLGDNELMSTILGAFCARNLKPDGRSCPNRVDVWGALCLWTPGAAQRAAHHSAMSTYAYPPGELRYHLETEWGRVHLAQDPVLLLSVDGRGVRHGDPVWSLPPLQGGAVANAFAVWFRAELVPGVTLDTGPGGDRTAWGIGIFEVPATVLADRVHRPLQLDVTYHRSSWVQVTVRP